MNYIKNDSPAIKQNKDDPEKNELSLPSCVPHIYHEHSARGDWCVHEIEPGKSYKSCLHGKLYQTPTCSGNLKRYSQKQGIMLLGFV